MNKELVLANGVLVNLCQQESANYFNINVGCRAGPVFETKENNGLSHFLEHMLFEGTKQKKGSYSIVNQMEKLGVNTYAVTGNSIMAFSVQSIENTRKIVENLYLLIGEPSFPSDRIQNEKRVIHQEMIREKNDPDCSIFFQQRRCLYGDHPLAYPIAGTRKNINSFTRKDIVSFWGRVMCGKNFAIAVTGKFDMLEMEDLVIKYFSRLPTGNKMLPSEQKIDWSDIKAGCQTYWFEQYDLSLFFLRSDSGITIREELIGYLAEKILGDGQTCRLFKALRGDTGYCYAFGADFTFDDNIWWTILNIGSDRKSVKRNKRAIEKVLISLSSDGITDEELEIAKSKLKLETAVNFSNPVMLGSRLVQNLLEDEDKGIIDLQNVLSLIESISAQDINDFFSFYVNVDDEIPFLMVPKGDICNDDILHTRP